MKYQKLYTAGDGFCYNHVWPMWSELLANIMQCEWTNLSTFGAGNEAIANLVLDELEITNNLENTLWIIQWTGPARLDLKVNDVDYQIIQDIGKDPEYYDNFIKTAKGKKYWCSSASQISWVEQHRRLITNSQQIDRSKLFQQAVAHALSQTSADWKFMMAFATPWYMNNPWIDHSRWIEQDMQSFRNISEYDYLDDRKAQPISSVHLDFLERYVLPWIEHDQSKLHDLRQQVIQQDQQRQKQG